MAISCFHCCLRCLHCPALGFFGSPSILPSPLNFRACHASGDPTLQKVQIGRVWPGIDGGGEKMKIWAENVGFASKTWKIGSFGFAIVRLSFGNRSLSFAYRLQSFAIVRYRSLIVRYRSLIVHYRSPIVRYRSPIVHLSFTYRSPIVHYRSPNSPLLFACSSLQFPFQLFLPFVFQPRPKILIF